MIYHAFTMINDLLQSFVYSYHHKPSLHKTEYRWLKIELVTNITIHVVSRKHFFKFFKYSEGIASEFLENLEEMFPWYF